MLSRALGNMLNVSRCCTTYRKQQLKDLELCPAHHLFISYVCRNPGSTQDRMAEALCIDKTTVAHRLARLEETGYVDRRPSPQDGRCRCVYPTQRALAVYPQVHGAFEDFTAQALQGLSEADQAELERLTELVRQNAVRLIRGQRDAKQGGEKQP